MITDLQTRILSSPFDIPLNHPRDLARAVEIHEQADPGVAIARLREFAFFGITERMRESLDLLAYRFSWRRTATEPHLNQGPGRPRRDDISGRTLQALERLNRRDIELYTGARQLFHEEWENMMGQLLEDNARAMRRDSPRLVLTTVDYRFTEPVPGEGWHFPEKDGDLSWCWTGPDCRSTLDLHIAEDHDYLLAFHILAASSPDILSSLRLEVNGKELVIAQETLPLPRGWTFYALIRRSVLDPGCQSTRLTFVVNRTIAPKQSSGSLPSARLVGLAFAWVRIAPSVRKEDCIVDFRAPVLGDGWYLPESADGEFWTWSGPQAESTVFVQLAADKDLNVNIHARFAIDQETLDGFEFSVNGVPISLAMAPIASGGVVFEGVVPREAVGRSEGFARLSFRVGETKVPEGVSPDNQPPRRLGIAVQFVRLWDGSSFDPTVTAGQMNPHEDARPLAGE